MIRTTVETCRENSILSLTFLQNKDPKQSVNQDALFSAQFSMSLRLRKISNVTAQSAFTLHYYATLNNLSIEKRVISP